MKILIILNLFLAFANSSHTSTNGSNVNSDVIVTYSGHAEAIDPKPVLIKNSFIDHPSTEVKILIPESFATDTTPFFDEDTESVIFVPNEKPVLRQNNYQDDRISVGDIIGRKTVGDVVGKNIRLETESPVEDILFISGKNMENVEKPQKKEHVYNDDTRRSNQEGKRKKILLNCSQLDCNNTLKSVCGGKMADNQWKYRLFLNECYFRKVNCDFKYEVNRYRVMPDELCKHVGSHQSGPLFTQNQALPAPPLPRDPPAPVPNIRRSFSSRRSLNIEVDGSFCSHACPPTCPDDYTPECAVTSTGRRKVFINHCQLDYNSCFFGTVWHKRPLSDCVGTQKADIRQNRAFIGWMQRVGLVDGKGRLAMA